MLREQWYAVLESDEVKVGKPSYYKRLGYELVFWRTDAGKIVAMQDLCPHRQAKLSLGKIVDGNIECPFHGFQFNSSGECALVPANGKNGAKPKAMRVRVFPTREAYNFIWVWHGEPRAAEDYPSLPFYTEQGLGNFSYSTLRKRWDTHYTRVIENQLDVAHLPFVHASTIGRGGRKLINGPFTVLEDETLYVWLDNELDRGQVARKPGEMSRPSGNWLLSFKYPNIWLNRLSDKFILLAAFAPIDDEQTMIYIRFYQNLVSWKPLRKLFTFIAAKSSSKILSQDEGVVSSQRPKQGGLSSGDKYIPADRPILLYYMHRNELERSAPPPEPPANPDAELEVAGLSEN
ncbi:aromatic ring-hydroxylating dioxygenase subunit alpha [Candidatus Chlorohelix sp.]|uniref:aromatic ring-hydroxylating dioxygenase subunit alpha n=1 Tax=Candidatus Chlorohelix sp. TaxID=3139201 RepID=UPI00304C22E7